MQTHALKAGLPYGDDRRPAVLRGRQVDYWLLGAVLGLVGLGLVGWGDLVGRGCLVE